MAKVRADEIHKLRESKGWSQEMLAKNSGIDPKTMSKLLNGGECRLSTISLIAEALGAEPGSLILGNEPDDETIDVTSWDSVGKKVKVKIEFDLEFDSFDDLQFVQTMLPKLRAAVGMDHQINVIAVARGSVLVTLSINQEDADSLIVAFLHGTLDQFSVKSLNVLSDHFECPYNLPAFIDLAVREEWVRQRPDPPLDTPPFFEDEPESSPHKPEDDLED